MGRFIFLMRHAEHDGGTLNVAGAKGILAVAGRFGEWLEAEPINVRWYFTSAVEVIQTASVLYRDVQSAIGDAPGPSQRLGGPNRFRDASKGGALPNDMADDPIGFGAYRPAHSSYEALQKAIETSSSNESAPLLIGNEPMIGWLAAKLAHRPWPLAEDDGIAMDHGELVCLERVHGRWIPIWTITPDDRKAVESITGKIDSKMNSAKILGAVITALFTFVVTDVLRDKPVWLDWVALGALGTSAGLYFSALFLYDGLLMPPRFWASALPPKPSESKMRNLGRRVMYGRPGFARPPSPAARVLQQAMVRIWTRLFVPATILLGMGLATLVGAATIDADKPFEPNFWAATFAALWLLPVVLWVSSNRPNLGVSD